MDWEFARQDRGSNGLLRDEKDVIFWKRFLLSG